MSNSSDYMSDNGSYNKFENDFDKSEESDIVEQSYKPILLNAINLLILHKRIWTDVDK